MFFASIGLRVDFVSGFSLRTVGPVPVAHQHLVIGDRLFVALVLKALVTSVASGPASRRHLAVGPVPQRTS